jgi:hypothetical protein
MQHKLARSPWHETPVRRNIWAQRPALVWSLGNMELLYVPEHVGKFSHL